MQALKRHVTNLICKEKVFVRHTRTCTLTLGCNSLESNHHLPKLLLTRISKWSLRHDRVSAARFSSDGPKTSDSAKCWKCGREVDQHKEQFVCFCGVLQAPDPRRNYFQVMGLMTSFDLDAKVLSEKLKELQKVLHPDKYSQRSAEEKLHSEQHSAIVNKAFETLSKPLSRGLYMLSLYGESIEEGHLEMDQEFLMNIMDINERLAEVESLNDLEEFKKINEAKREELTQELSSAFKREDIKHAKSILQMLQYFANIEEKIKEIRLTLL